VIKFIQGLKITPNSETGLDTFHVYASSQTKASINKRKCITNRFDGVQIKFNPEAEDANQNPDDDICQVLGIISVATVGTADIRFLLIVTILQKIEKKTGCDVFWEFPLYQYKKQPYRQNLVLHLVEASAISKPCMLLPCPSRSRNIHKSWSQGRNNYMDIRIFVITYNTIDRERNDTITTCALNERPFEFTHMYRRLHQHNEDNLNRENLDELDNNSQNSEEEDGGEDEQIIIREDRIQAPQRRRLNRADEFVEVWNNMEEVD
jgi:hypothetical protein